MLSIKYKFHDAVLALCLLEVLIRSRFSTCSKFSHSSILLKDDSLKDSFAVLAAVLVHSVTCSLLASPLSISIVSVLRSSIYGVTSSNIG